MLARNERYESSVMTFLEEGDRIEAEEAQQKLLEARHMKSKALLNMLVTFVELNKKYPEFEADVNLALEESKKFLKEV
jgi:hypothetical protein